MVEQNVTRMRLVSNVNEKRQERGREPIEGGDEKEGNAWKR